MRDTPDSSCSRSMLASNASVTVPASMSEIDRRRFLQSVAGAGAVVLAGCADDSPEEDLDDVTTYVLGFVDNDERIEVELSADEELLYPALDAGVEIPYRCEAGRCGVCTAKYDGDATDVVEHDGNEYLSDEQIGDGWILTCVAYARDDFDLEVAHPDDE